MVSSPHPWSGGLTPYAINSVVAQALATLGYNQPTSALPVKADVQPVVVLGGGVLIDYKMYFIHSAVALGTGIFIGITCPIGKQWKVSKMSCSGDGGAGVYPAVYPAAAVGNQGQLLSATASGFTLSTASVYPQAADVNASQPLCYASAGDQVGVMGNVNGLSGGAYITIFVEESIAP